MCMAQDKTPTRYINAGQVAEYIGVTTRTVRQMTNDGRLKAYRLGDQIVRYRIADIDAAFENYR